MVLTMHLGFLRAMCAHRLYRYMLRNINNITIRVAIRAEYIDRHLLKAHIFEIIPAGMYSPPYGWCNISLTDWLV